LLSKALRLARQLFHYAMKVTEANGPVSRDGPTTRSQHQDLGGAPADARKNGISGASC
jgi:hypothetical protein